MSKEAVELIELQNGLRLVCRHERGVAVDYFGVVVNAGSRDDPEGFFGLAHFVEHTIFKGTERRRSWHIINRMESCGGELNAYTTKEMTAIYTLFPSGNLSRAVDLVADLICNSRFPTSELEKEREVVADEIDSYLDIPSEAIYDEFEDRLFSGSSLGHNILGTKKALSKFDSKCCRDYIDRLYTASNMVVFYSGRISPQKVARLVEKYFSGISGSTLPIQSRTSAVAQAPFVIERKMSLHQSNVIVGSPVCDMFDDRRYALSVLVNMLGGPGMNSLLNVELREKRGLVYSVDASTAMLTDTGIFTIYYGCDHDDSVECRRLVDDVISRVIDRQLTPRRLSSALRQHLGQMIVASDNRESMIISFAKQVLYRGAIVSKPEVVERIKSLTSADISAAAQMIAPERMSMLTFS